MSQQTNITDVAKTSMWILTKKQKQNVQLVLILLLVLAHAVICFSQNNPNNTFMAKSDFKPEIKESVRFADIPEIRDSVKRISGIQYGIVSNPLFPKYEVQKIDAAKMRNEPNKKLYHALLKAGYSPLYNMPYGEFLIGNLRAKDLAYGARLKHFSSSAQLEDAGYSGFSDNLVNIHGKKFYKKHTLNGNFDYQQNVLHYYGYDTSLHKINDRNITRQRYQLIEPTLVLQSHFTDSTRINHRIKAGFYNLQGLPMSSETNVNVDAVGTMFLNKEKLNVGLSTDFFNHQWRQDTINDLIVSLAPSFLAGGKKWKAEMGLKATLNRFNQDTRFYFYPNLNVEYDIYESLIIPFAGVNGGLLKNSLRSFSNENPFIDSTFRYANSNNKYNIFLGLKGKLSSNTGYEIKASYSQVDSMHFYAIKYSSQSPLFNRFDVLYDNASLITVGGQLKYQMHEKMQVIGKANYYIYKLANLERAYHKPDYDLTLSGIYNLQSKIILRADVFLIGQQWVLTQKMNDMGNPVLINEQLKGLVDVNLEAEYRYTKMLSFFARFNNIANQRYYRWERYPTQRFNFTLGLSFVPF